MQAPSPSPAPVTSEPDATGVLAPRMWLSSGLAVGLHLSLVAFAYLMPEHRPPQRSQPIIMDVVRRTPPEPPKPEPEPPRPAPPEQAPPEPPAARPLPSLLRPVARQPSETPQPQSPAISVPEQQPAQPGEPTGLPKGPIDLFNRGSISKALGGSSDPLGTPPKTQNRLLKDERLDEKKDAEFPLVPEKGGGLKYEGPNFVAHIGPDGALKFDDRGPIGFAKGQSGFSFDFTDLAMRGAKQDPYGSQKRKFRDFTAKIREEMRRKNTQSAMDAALAHLPGELQEIWESSRPAGVRRRELFEYWVNCADDKDGGEAQGIRARKQVEEFIRRHLPPSSPLAFTDEELRRFSGSRQGLPAFDPYRNLDR